MNTENRVIIFMQGAPGSGKSTKAREFVENYPDKKFVIVNKDSLRSMSGAKYSKSLEKVVNTAQREFIVEALAEGHSVIVDNTNFNPKIINNIIASVGMHIDKDNISMFSCKMETSLEECLRRNALREGDARVPDNVVESFYSKDGDIFPDIVKGFYTVPMFSNTPNEEVKLQDGRTVWLSRSMAVVGTVFAEVDGVPHLLIAQRGSGAADNHGKWNIPCGYLDYDETLRQAAAREIYEETGVYLNIAEQCQGNMVFTNDDPRKDARQNVSFWYKFMLNRKFKTVDDLPLPNIDNSEVNEVSAIKWIPFYKGELDKYEFAFNHRERLEEFARTSESTGFPKLYSNAKVHKGVITINC